MVQHAGKRPLLSWCSGNNTCSHASFKKESFHKMRNLIEDWESSMADYNN